MLPKKLKINMFKLGMRVVPAHGVPASGSMKWRAILKVQPYRKVATEDPV